MRCLSNTVAITTWMTSRGKSHFPKYSGGGKVAHVRPFTRVPPPSSQQGEFSRDIPTPSLPSPAPGDLGLGDTYPDSLERDLPPHPHPRNGSLNIVQRGLRARHETQEGAGSGNEASLGSETSRRAESRGSVAIMALVLFHGHQETQKEMLF